MSATRFMLGVLLLASFSWGGCTFVLHPINETFACHSSPIDGWKRVGEVDYTFPKGSPQNSLNPGYSAISDDVQKYVKKKKLPVADFIFFEDGTGRHAVSFRVDSSGSLIGGTCWVYVAIYDKNNERVKVVRYVEGYYVM